MALHLEKLIRMANQIGGFFVPYPHEQQVSGVRQHLQAFWSPVMKRDLAVHVKDGGEGLSPIIIEAVQPDLANWMTDRHISS